MAKLTVKDRALDYLTAHPGPHKTGEIQKFLKITYPINKDLKVLASSKLIRRHGRGKWGIPETTPARQRRTTATPAPKNGMLSGTIEDQMTVGGSESGVLVTIGSDRYEFTWTEFAAMVRSTAARS